jgi:hypothetical protein
LVGRTKIPYQELFCLTRKELSAVIEGHEIDQKEMIEVARLHASITVSPHVRKEDKPKIEPKKLWPLPWDKKGTKVVSKESISKVKKLAEIYRSGKIIPRSNGNTKD